MLIMGDRIPEGPDHCDLRDPRGSCPKVFFTDWESRDSDDSRPVLFNNPTVLGAKTYPVLSFLRRQGMTRIPQQW